MSKNLTWDRHVIQRLRIAYDLAVLQGLGQFRFDGMAEATWDGQPFMHVDYAKRLIDTQTKFFNKVTPTDSCYST